MHILIIGGAGYIGSHVTRAAAEKGHRITVFDNLATGARMNLFPGNAFIHGDILDYPVLLAAMRDSVDAVIHLAAAKAAGESMIRPEKYARNNLIGTINILNAMTEAGVSRFVFSSSAAVYGEPRYLPIDEEHPTDPMNFYGFTKLEIERLLGWYSKLRGIHAACLRYFNAAGYDPEGSVRGLEQNPANLLPVIMEVAAGIRNHLDIFGNDYDTPDGTGVRDYVHVTDLAVAHVAALDYLTKHTKDITVNLGSESGISVQEMVDTARHVTGMEIPATVVPRRAGDPARLVASSSRAAELLGWHARYSDAETLVRTSWEVYRNLPTNR